MKHLLSLQNLSLRWVTTIVLLAVMVTACDDEETINPVSIQFTTANLTVSEAAGEQTVNLTLASAAPADATIEINIENTNVTYGTDYTTNPNGSSGKVTVAITKGQTSAQFKFTPVNNNLLASAVKTVTFTVGIVTGPIENGTTASFIVTITDDEGPSAVNFETSSSNTAEGNATGLDINLPLSAAAPGTGQILVNLASTDAVYGTHYTTEPAAVEGKITLPVAVGDVAKTIKVLPINNTNVNAARVITFTIESASTAVQLGTNIIHTFTINDDETPSTVAFATAEGSISEGLTEGANIVVNLTPAANASGTLEISFTSTSAVYGTHFTTEPAAVEGKINLTIESGAGSASFKILPIEDTEINANRTINFSMTASTGIVIFESGATSTLYSHTITDNDAVTNISDVRAMYQGSNMDVTTSLRIRGIVTSSNPQVNTNNIWVQDATAGIVVRFVTANNNTIKRGDEVVVELNGGQFTVFSGLLQVQNVPNANVTVIDANNTLPTPQVVSVTEFKTGNYEGKLVRINDVGFVDADGTLTMNGSRTVSDGTNTTIVRTESGASFSGTVMPYGIGTVTGLAGRFNTDPQIIPIVFEEDVFVNNPIGSIGTTGTLNDFGSVNKDAESASQQYTVQGTGLSKDIIVTASANYKVSLDNTTFTASVTIPAASANNATTVYVKFTPTTGVNQALEGTITHKSLGSAVGVINLSGTESGNAGASTLMLTENFSYGASTGNLLDVSSSNWLITGTSVVNPIQYITTSLSMNNYAASGIDGSVTLTTTGQDVRRSFTTNAITTGTIYASALVNISSVQNTGDYFINFSDGGTTNFFTRVFVKNDAGVLRFGASHNSGTAIYSTENYSIGTTYLLVLKYDFSTGTASLYVLNAVVATEPGVATVSATGTAPTGGLSHMSLRQGTAANAPALTVDGIRVAQTWADLFN